MHNPNFIFPKEPLDFQHSISPGFDNANQASPARREASDGPDKQAPPGVSSLG
jgi:hypothetical protein